MKEVKKRRLDVLDTIEVEKGFKYGFIAGMSYFTDKLTLDNNSQEMFPFSSYYMYKIEDLEQGGTDYKPLINTKLPLIVLDYGSKSKIIKFDKIINPESKERTIYPYLGVKEREETYLLEFVAPKKIKTWNKNSAWLGKAKKELKDNKIENKDKFKLKESKISGSWMKGLRQHYKEEFNQVGHQIDSRENIIDLKRALNRAWDSDLKTFHQLPWRDHSGYSLDYHSYSLLGFEAKRVNYFYQMWLNSKDKDYLKWSQQLINLFLNSNLYKEVGNTLIWYNMTHYNGKNLSGFFYLGCGYYGYPSGQSTMSFHLLDYLDRKENWTEKDKKLLKLIKRNLKFIIQTQKNNGRWPFAFSSLSDIKQNMSQEESIGAIGESVRALLKAYKIIENSKYLEAAKKGLKSLPKPPICYNGLRDIGTNEPEGFSAYSVINACLDAYDILNQEEYLKKATRYSYYLSSWHYSQDLTFNSKGRTKTVPLKGFAHPISKSIPLRVSPYETCLSSRAFYRMFRKTDNKFWRNLSLKCYEKVNKAVNKDHSLSEGIFYNEDGFQKISTEQTFATAELLKTFLDLRQDGLVKDHLKKRSSKENVQKKDKGTIKEIEIRENNEKEIIIQQKGEKKIKIDPEDFKIIKNDQNIIELSFNGSYKFKNRIRRQLLKIFRKQNYLLSIPKINWLWKGAKPNNNSLQKEKKFSEVGKVNWSYKINHKAKEIFLSSSSPLHKIETKIKPLITDSGNLKLRFDPLIVKTLDHDVKTNKVMLEFPHEEVRVTESPLGDIVNPNSFELTYEANWTHAGKYKTDIEISIN